MTSRPYLVDGVVLLAPMLSLNKLAKRGMNRLLLPLITLISQFLPTVPMVGWCRLTPGCPRVDHA
jgi:uncharacterized membrane protein YadS